MRIPIVILIAVSIVGASFAVSLSAMNYFWPLCPQGLATLPLKGPFPRFFANEGVAFIASLPAWNATADSEDNTKRSNASVCENGYLLGPAHSPPAEVASKGN